jgi:hypothetical protein
MKRDDLQLADAFRNFLLGYPRVLADNKVVAGPFLQEDRAVAGTRERGGCGPKRVFLVSVPWQAL